MVFESMFSISVGSIRLELVEISFTPNRPLRCMNLKLDLAKNAEDRTASRICLSHLSDMV